MKISVGIPTRNRSAFVVRAIRSVLQQTYRDFEIIVSDNSSTDDTIARVAELDDPRLVVVRQQNDLGMIGNFNACLASATGELFIMVSDDDLLEPRALEELSAPFRAATGTARPADIGVVWCPAKILSADGTQKWVSDTGPPIESGTDLVQGLFEGTRGPRFCSIMMRRSDAVSAGGFRPEHGPICDVGCWSQIAVRYRHAICVQTPLAGYTIHQSSTSSRPEGSLWQRSGENVCSAVVDVLRAEGRGDEEQRIRAAGRDNISNLLATVMMQFMGKPGWVRYWAREALRAPQYLFTPMVARRIIRDGWKILRLQH